jgi:hypothetical protein
MKTNISHSLYISLILAGGIVANLILIAILGGASG